MNGMVPFVALFLSTALALQGSVYYTKNTGYSFVEKIDYNAVAYGTFVDSISQIGWASVNITTNPSYPDNVQAFAAGYLEGYMTSERIDQQYNNVIGTFPGYTTVSSIPPKLVNFFTANANWTASMIDTNQNSDYWIQVNNVYQQQEGLKAGYWAATKGSSTQLQWIQLQLLSAVGDLFDIVPALNEDLRPDVNNMTKHQYERFAASQGHCSALIKVSDNLQELFFGHTSWFIYESLIKFVKAYRFNFNNKLTKAKLVHMSSYPGTVVSFDDFYVTDHGLNVIETSLGFYNNSLYQYVVPETLLYAIRVMLATRIAESPKQWCEWFKLYNSGTYNNQYLVLNITAFTPGYALPQGSFYVLGQFPGPYVAYSDETVALNFGYWPSYNMPFHRELFEVGGYEAVVAKYGPTATYSACPRATIFRRDAGKVETLFDFKNIMTYNNYQFDPLSGGMPWNAISARDDLATDRPGCSGGYDAKVSSYKLWKSGLLLHMQAGPTRNHQPTFSFSNTSASCNKKLVGLPDVWNFDFQTFAP